MKHVSLIALILAVGAGFAFAQECPSSCKSEAPKATVSVAAKVEKLQTSAEKGCATSKTLLDSLQKEFKAESPAALVKMVSQCEDWAGKGCDVSKKVLAKIDAAFAAPKKAKPVLLSARIARMQKGCTKGCEKSKTFMASLLKQYEAKDGAALVAMVKDWEAKAENGCTKCTTKLAELSAKMPARRAKLSARLAKLDQGCEKGCETSKTKMDALVKEYEAKDSKTLIANVVKWEQKASNGCKSCVEKLTTLSAKLAPAKKATATKAAKDCSDCTDCTDCTGCPGK